MKKKNSDHLPTLDDMIHKYRQVRIAVFEEATVQDRNTGSQADNQALLRGHVERICGEANLARYTTAPLLWEKMWRTIRYAGIRASTARAEIDGLASHFDDLAMFDAASWNPGKGSDWRQFMSHGRSKFSPRRVRNAHKLDKTVRIARQLSAFERGGGEPVSFITGDGGPNDWKRAHANLMARGYTGHLTALHLMMDLGFPVIKPDIVVSRLMLAWGWLHSQAALQGHAPLPALHLHQLQEYGFHYTRPAMYGRVIDLAIQLCGKLAGMTDALRSDIGWVTAHPLRELDLFIVKYGQEPDPAWGLSRNLAATAIDDWRYRFGRRVNPRVACR